VPDYRLVVFDQLAKSMGDFKVASGLTYFTSGFKTVSESRLWWIPLRNRFLFGKKYLWQQGAIRTCLPAEVVLMEWNPHVLSTWVVLFLRLALFRKTLLWGHIISRDATFSLAVAGAIRRFMARLSSGVVTYTNSDALTFKASLPSCRVWAAPNSNVTAAEMGCAMGSKDTALNTLFVGRLISRKKPLLLLEGWFIAKPYLPASAKLVFTGEGPERAKLEQRARELNITEDVIFYGHVNDPGTLREIYSRALVSTSPGYVGLSSIQSIAYGVPILVAESEPHSPEIEACLANETAVFFASNDPSSLAAALVKVYQNIGHWHEARTSIAAFALKNYSVENMVASMARAFSEVTSSTSLDQETIALIWSQYGPYHFARLAEVRNRIGADIVLGVEITSKSATYAWTRDKESRGLLQHPLSDRGEAECNAYTVYSSAYRLFREMNVGVVFIPGYWPINSLALLLAAKNVGAKVVVMSDSHALTAKADGPLLWIKKIIVRSFDAALLAGRPQLSYFPTLGLPAERIVVGYDAVDNDYFWRRSEVARTQRDVVRRRNGLPNQYFLNVGRMVEKKNLGVLVDAYAIAKQHLGSTCPKLVLVGDGPLRSALQDRCLGRGLSYVVYGNILEVNFDNAADVYFPGFRQVDQLPEFYALATAFVLTSLEEEWGLVVNEAMASGLPVIVSRAAGCAADLVHHGKNGFQFDPKCPEELAEFLISVCGNNEMQTAMGSASRDIISNWGCVQFADAAVRAMKIAISEHA